MAPNGYQLGQTTAIPPYDRAKTKVGTHVTVITVMFIYLQNTGITMKANKRLQINVAVDKVPGIE